MAEYIEREPLLEILEGLYDHHLTMGNYSADSATQDCIEAVINAPTADVVPVVRCKDCKHFRLYNGFKRGECRLFCELISSMQINDYCSYGERRCEGGK